MAEHTIFRIRGKDAQAALELLVTCAVGDLDADRARWGLLLRGDGRVVAPCAVSVLAPRDGAAAYALSVDARHAEAVLGWLRAAEQGTSPLDPNDPHVRIAGSLEIDELTDTAQADAARRALAAAGEAPQADAPAHELAQAQPHLFALEKPYFVGQAAACRGLDLPAKPRWTPPAAPEAPGELRRTVLSAWHRDHGAKLAPFAGWEMPIQYPPGIFAEHAAVRTAAGLFDISHMGALDVSGPDAEAFLQAALTNSVARLRVGAAQYTCLLLPDGSPLDDAFVYRRDADRFLLVVNAANADRVRAWLAALRDRRAVVDLDMPSKELPNRVDLADLRDAGAESRVGLALQGPLSPTLLERVADEGRDARRAGRLRPNRFRELALAGAPVLAARTGYTGAPRGYELFVHPDRAQALWSALLEAGAGDGALPAGLGARDSLRVEAGLPLFGHELDGDLALSPTEAGYPFVVRFEKPFFVGRGPYLRAHAAPRRKLVRLRGRGRRTVRPGHRILGDDHRPAGTVTSFAFLDASQRFVALACVAANFDDAPGRRVTGLRATEWPDPEPPPERKSVDLTVLPRFPDRAEKDGWPAQYANEAP